MSKADTTIAALISISHVRAPLKRRVLTALQGFGKTGATCDELEVALGLKHQTLSARVRELYLDGWIRKSKFTRLTTSGRHATVYKIRKTRKKRRTRERCPRCGQVVPR